MIDPNKLPIPEDAILEAAKMIYGAFPYRGKYGYAVKWDDLTGYQRHQYKVLARRTLRAAEAVRLGLAA